MEWENRILQSKNDNLDCQYLATPKGELTYLSLGLVLTNIRQLGWISIEGHFSKHIRSGNCGKLVKLTPVLNGLPKVDLRSFIGVLGWKLSLTSDNESQSMRTVCVNKRMNSTLRISRADKISFNWSVS